MIYYGDDGNSYTLTNCVGHNGNSSIYKINNDSTRFAKISPKYTCHDYILMALKELDDNQEIAKYVIMPQVILYQDKELSKQCGYVLDYVDCSTLLSDIICGKRLLSIRKRAIVGLNLCKTLAAIHKTSSNSMIIGDFSCNNIAVNIGNCEVHFINDEFQVSFRCNGRNITLPCKELHPDFFMPEILKMMNCYKGSTLEQLSVLGVQNGFTTFTLYTDYYCLAYNLHLLLLNCAPFSCALPATIAGKASQAVPPLNMLRMNGNYCYSNLYNDGTKRTIRPDYCPDFNILTPRLQSLFVRAFETGARQPELRPSPDEFIFALSEYIESLDFCECDGWNHYIRSGYKSSHCEWCRVERITGSFTEFPALEDIKYCTIQELKVIKKIARRKKDLIMLKSVKDEITLRRKNENSFDEQ